MNNDYEIKLIRESYEIQISDLQEKIRYLEERIKGKDILIDTYMLQGLLAQAIGR